jgi:hypothetical protein
VESRQRGRPSTQRLDDRITTERGAQIERRQCWRCIAEVGPMDYELWWDVPPAEAVARLRRPAVPNRAFDGLHAQLGPE